MSDTVNQLRFAQLTKEREVLVLQLEEVSKVLTDNTDPETWTRLKLKQERLYRELSEKEVELGKLRDTADEPGLRADRISKYDTSAQRIRRPPQEVFPYLLDRSEQEESLVQALTAHRSEKSTRPFVCVVHGDERECHMFYLTRMKTRSLPGFLSGSSAVEAKNTPIQQFEIKWPLNKKTNEDYEESLWYSLRAETHGGRPVSNEEVINFIASHKLSVIIRCFLSTEDLNSSSLNSIDWFFRFWDKWPEMPNLLFLVAISFKYQRNSNWIRHPVRSWSRSKLNQQLRQYLKQLDFSEYTKIYGTILPELVAIRRSDAEALIRHEQVSPYSFLDDQDIRTLYSDQTLCTPDGWIPMEILLNRLIDISDEKQKQNLRRL
jgi:hypothetical protein